MSSPHAQRWGKALRAQRHARGLSQTELANLADVDQRMLSNWELGHWAPRDEVRPKLAKALGVPVDAIFSYDDAETVA